MNSAISQLGRLITEDPAECRCGRGDLGRATGCGVGADDHRRQPIDWQPERRALIDMVSHYLQRERD